MGLGKTHERTRVKPLPGADLGEKREEGNPQSRHRMDRIKGKMNMLAILNVALIAAVTGGEATCAIGDAAHRARSKTDRT